MFDLEGEWPNKVKQTGSTLGLSEIEPPTTHLCMISYTGREPVFLLSFIPSDNYVSNSFTILSSSSLLVIEHPQQYREALKRSRTRPTWDGQITSTGNHLEIYWKSEILDDLFLGIFRLKYPQEILLEQEDAPIGRGEHQSLVFWKTTGHLFCHFLRISQILAQVGRESPGWASFNIFYEGCNQKNAI